MEYAIADAGNATVTGQLAPAPQLSETTVRVYNEVVRVCEETGGIPPSTREIMRALSIASTSNVHYHLLRLQAVGLITREHGQSRGITVVGGKWSPPRPAMMASGAAA